MPASALAASASVLGRSVAMRELFEQLEAVAKSDCSVLHRRRDRHRQGAGRRERSTSESARKDGAVRGGRLRRAAGELIEAELFGHERGAFTGADSRAQGLFERPTAAPCSSTRWASCRRRCSRSCSASLERAQGHAARRIDCRARSTCASSPPPTGIWRARCNEGRFRADLFFRLAVVSLRVPPLRERLDDIPLLVERFLDELRQREGARIPSSAVAGRAGAAAAQPWPGNVRELRNVVERAALKLGRAARRHSAEARARRRGAVHQGADARRRGVRAALPGRHPRARERNVTEAARQAGVDRRNFQRLLRRHQISPRELKGR